MGDQAANPAAHGSTADSTADRSQSVTVRAPAGPGEGGVAARQGRQAQPIGQERAKFSAKGDFPYSEVRLAAALNVSRDELRQLRIRHFRKGIHFEKKHGDGEILLNADAVGILVRHTGANVSNLNLEDCLPCEKKTGGPRMMTITDIPINPRMVEAVFDDDPVEHLVDCGRNATLARGDRIEVSQHEVQKGVYQLTSPLPRDRRRPHL